MAKAKKSKTVIRKKLPVVTAKVSGGRAQQVEAATLGELKNLLQVPSYQATVDGEPQNDNNFRLTSDSVVILTAPVKGA